MDQEVRLYENIEIPMRDRVILRADLYRPDTEEALPAILLRLPYGKDEFRTEGAGIYSPRFYAAHGYNVIIQDCRGFHHSDGVPDPGGKNEPEDGYDTIEWIAAQPFCDGNVGTFGLSFFGYVQLAAAATNPPHLKCICPFECSAARPPFVNANGSYAPYHLTWLYNAADDQVRKLQVSDEERARIQQAVDENRPTLMDQVIRIHPWPKMPALNIPGFSFFDEYMESVDGTNDPSYWEAHGYPLDIEKMPYPVFLATGWNDHVRNQEMDNYVRFRAFHHNDTGKVRLVIGPWAHGQSMSAVVGETDYGAENAGTEMGLMTLLLHFFDRWLKGREDAMQDDPPVYYYTLHENVWREASVWPPEGIETKRLYFSSAGQAAADMEDGRLLTEKETAGLREENGQDAEAGDSAKSCGAAEASEDTFVHDPLNPVPSELPGVFKMNGDFAEVQTRPDVVTYTSEPAEKPLLMTGPVSASVWFSTDADDGDLYIRLSDVSPEGRAVRITSGELRLRYRNSLFTPEYVTPGEAACYEIPMGDISYLLTPGHRLRIDIAGSAFPYADPNPGTKAPTGRGETVRRAVHRILHDGAHPSFVSVPVMKNG